MSKLIIEKGRIYARENSSHIKIVVIGKIQIWYTEKKGDNWYSGFTGTMPRTEFSQSLVNGTIWSYRSFINIVKHFNRIFNIKITTDAADKTIKIATTTGRLTSRNVGNYAKELNELESIADNGIGRNY